MLTIDPEADLLADNAVILTALLQSHTQNRFLATHWWSSKLVLSLIEQVALKLPEWFNSGAQQEGNYLDSQTRGQTFCFLFHQCT